MHYSELTPGRNFILGPAMLTEDEIIAFARTWDPQPFHVDRAEATAGRWGGVIASGWQTCCVAMRMFADQILAGSGSFGSPGLDYLKWPAPVRAGDALTLKLTVLDSRRSERRPEIGFVRTQWRMANQRDEAVLELVATSLFQVAPDAP